MPITCFGRVIFWKFRRKKTKTKSKYTPNTDCQEGTRRNFFQTLSCCLLHKAAKHDTWCYFRRNHLIRSNATVHICIYNFLFINPTPLTLRIHCIEFAVVHVVKNVSYYRFKGVTFNFHHIGCTLAKPTVYYINYFTRTDFWNKETPYPLNRSLLN